MRYWLLVITASLVLASIVGRSLERAEQAERSWGRTQTVVVASRPIRAGGLLAGSVRTERWPMGLVPEAALRALPSQARATTEIDPGAPLTTSMAEPGDPAVRGRVTIAIPLPDAHLPVRDGERVDLWATADPTVVDEGDHATRRVATGARVIGSSDRSVVVAVEPGQVAEVADAAATAVITLVGIG